MTRSRQCGWIFGVALLLGALPATAPQAKDGPARPRAREERAEGELPFRVGEKLDYRVSWENFMTAATAQMRVEERRPFFGRLVWHFQAVARTVEPARYLYAIDDQFDSYTDAASLASLQYETHKREMGKREDSVVRMSTEGQPTAAGDGPSVRVPAGTRDPLGAFYSLRVVDWEKNSDVRMPVYDGTKLYALRARKTGSAQSVTVPAGDFSATKIELRVFERGRELAQTRFVLWVADDAAKTPVLIEAELPFGSVRVELTRAR